jgi:hypothetical protein
MHNALCAASLITFGHFGKKEQERTKLMIATGVVNSCYFNSYAPRRARPTVQSGHPRALNKSGHYSDVAERRGSSVSRLDGAFCGVGIAIDYVQVSTADTGLV